MLNTRAAQRGTEAVDFNLQGSAQLRSFLPLKVCFICLRWSNRDWKRSYQQGLDSQEKKQYLKTVHSNSLELHESC